MGSEDPPAATYGAPTADVLSGTDVGFGTGPLRGHNVDGHEIITKS